MVGAWWFGLHACAVLLACYGRFLSVDKVRGKHHRPRSWNRYSYGQANPLKYVDPTGLYVVVATKDRATVAFAYANSSSFRAAFDTANRNTNFVVKLSSVASRDSRLQGVGVKGNTRWAGVPRMDGRTNTYSGVIESVVKMAGRNEVASQFGHELTHANELAQHGDIRQAPGARENSSNPGMWETEPAIEAGKDISAELSAGGDNSLTPEEQAIVFGSSAEWDKISPEAQQQCLSDLACLTLFSSGSQEPRKQR